MKEIALKNPSDADIIEFPIEQALILKEDGDVIPDPDTGRYKTTGETLTWSLRAGDTLIFPKYVAEYLLKTYPFLTEVPIPKEVLEAREKGEKSEDEVVSETTCKHCGFEAANISGLALHIASKHPGSLQ